MPGSVRPRRTAFQTRLKNLKEGTADGVELTALND